MFSKTSPNSLTIELAKLQITRSVCAANNSNALKITLVNKKKISDYSEKSLPPKKRPCFRVKNCSPE
ncbi:hypothetical protein J3Q64DRAFT_1841822 [Phycomyces blakesleeanus]|uniref:Uncharacterized protein n=2 Tax=Phycomyces blakesleeanus TaxID=4837 RepID=A0A167M0W3_PHYB8|nr:hypothetical protein PHYBLDRAFT_147242 [Phycomyces blakesleeanus NRRL 1555(-)]OAD71484.1 hypothetical protein PHYBLDRAFT_147242 [Phycomyces blakesleeanus NRRL 1555(-)]|eukprot:XP_018289524.1 hypothetical protein PHYBLDRAFT_147242 [Phycomyces blakesleeanus NRRL 1555(-)]